MAFSWKFNCFFLQIETLGGGVDILVSTPGRLLTIIKNGHKYSDQNNQELQEEDEENLEETDEGLIGKLPVNPNEKKKSKGKIITFFCNFLVVPILDLSSVATLVLDEVDRMLDLGQAPHIRQIFRYLPKPKKMVVGSRQQQLVATDHSNLPSENSSRFKGNMQVMMLTATLVSQVMDLVIRFAPRHQIVDLNWAFKIPPDCMEDIFFSLKF